MVENERIAKLEVQVNQNSADIQAIHKDVLDIKDVVTKAQGGWKALVWLGGAVATIIGIAIALWRALHG